ncbi:hypothetical protein [Nostoc sp. CCY0012]|uniref:hypothetical protein n=1 Tax=Nostoc sp. CCY0012 TaxID=1056123 RepID=UPI0039C6864D
MDVNLSREQIFHSWAKFFKPESLKSNLIVASIFLAGYEVLKSSIIERIVNFFSSDFNENGAIISENYKNQVLSLHKNPLEASLLWLKGVSAIDDADIKLIDDIRKHRNELAHELLRFITTADSDINIHLLEAIYNLVYKIDRWWIKEVDIPVNSDFDGQEIVDSDINSGNMLFIQMMITIATGEDSSIFWEEIQKTNRYNRYK